MLRGQIDDEAGSVRATFLSLVSGMWSKKGGNMVVNLCGIIIITRFDHYIPFHILFLVFEHKPILKLREFVYEFGLFGCNKEIRA